VRGPLAHVRYSMPSEQSGEVWTSSEILPRFAFFRACPEGVAWLVEKAKGAFKELGAEVKEFYALLGRFVSLHAKGLRNDQGL